MRVRLMIQKIQYVGIWGSRGNKSWIVQGLMGCKRQKATHVHLKPFINSSVGYLFIHLKVTKLESQGDSWLPSLLDLKWKWCRWGSLSLRPLALLFSPRMAALSSSCYSLSQGSREYPLAALGPSLSPVFICPWYWQPSIWIPMMEKKKQYNSFIF